MGRRPGWMTSCLLSSRSLLPTQEASTVKFPAGWRQSAPHDALLPRRAVCLGARTLAFAAAPRIVPRLHPVALEASPGYRILSDRVSVDLMPTSFWMQRSSLPFQSIFSV